MSHALVALAALTGSNAATPMPRRHAPGTGNDGPPLIVLVEDHEDTLSLYSQFLQTSGYRVDGFTTGDGVVDRVLREPPAALLLDIGLPDEDGVSICWRIRRDPRGQSVPIIAVSAWLGLQPPHVTVDSAPFTEALMKPFTPDQLLEVVRRWAPLTGRRPAT